MAEKPTAEPIYRVIFNNQGEVYELYTRYIFQSEMYGFVEIEELLFDENQHSKTSDETSTEASVDTDAKKKFEKLKLEFTGVKRSFIPLASIIRIDEMEQAGVVKVTSSKDDPKGNVRHFPSTAFKRPPVEPTEPSSDE